MTSLLGSGSVHMQNRFKKTNFNGGEASAEQSKAVCQKCLQVGHWTYMCKNAPVYRSRPTRTQQLKNPKFRPALMMEHETLPEDRAFEKKEEKTRKDKEKKKKRKRDSSSDDSDSSSSDDSNSSSGSDSDGSSSDSDTSSSDSDSSSSDSGSSSSSDSGSSSSSDSYSDSDSGSSSSDSESDSDSESPPPRGAKRGGKPLSKVARPSKAGRVDRRASPHLPAVKLERRHSAEKQRSGEKVRVAEKVRSAEKIRSADKLREAEKPRSRRTSEIPRSRRGSEEPPRSRRGSEKLPSRRGSEEREPAPSRRDDSEPPSERGFFPPVRTGTAVVVKEEFRSSSEERSPLAQSDEERSPLGDDRWVVEEGSPEVVLVENAFNAPSPTENERVGSGHVSRRLSSIATKH